MATAINLTIDIIGFAGLIACALLIGWLAWQWALAAGSR